MTQKLAICAPSHNLSDYIFATKACIDNQKKVINSNMSSTCPHNMANFGPLTAEKCWRVWGTAANFNGFRVLPSLYWSDVAHRRPTKLCTMFGCLLGCYAIYTFSRALPLTEFCTVQNSLYFQVLRYRILAALLHGTQQPSSAKLYGVVIQGMELPNFRRGCHLYSAGRPSRWASAHILVMAALCNRGAIIFLPCSFFLLSSIFFSSPNLSGHRSDVYHTSTHGVALVRI